MKIITALLLMAFSVSLWSSEFVVQLKRPISLEMTRQFSRLAPVEVELLSRDKKLVLIKFRSNRSQDKYIVDYLVKLKQHGFFSFVERNKKIQFKIPPRLRNIPNDPRFPKLWGLHHDLQPASHIHALAAWKHSIGSKKIRVAVIDTGIDITHKDLKPNLWINQKELNGKPGVDDDQNGYVDDIHGFDFVRNDPNPDDKVNHGTHVAGIIGAQGNNGLGIAGVAWNVSLMGLKIFGEGVSGGTLSMLIKSMQYAVDNKAHIINASFGNTAGSVFATKAFSEMLNLANENNIVFVAAAGNSSMDLEQKPHYPASFTHPNIITVAALEESGGLAVFSNWGIKSVDLAAPGQNIISTVVGGGTAYNSGTSMAAPFVAGSAAILLSMFPKLSVKEIKFVLMNSVTKLTRLEGKVISSGTLNLIKSIKLAKKVSYYKDSFQ